MVSFEVYVHISSYNQIRYYNMYLNYLMGVIHLLTNQQGSTLLHH